MNVVLVLMSVLFISVYSFIIVKGSNYLKAVVSHKKKSSRNKRIKYV
jgi:hypothetical protein